MTYYYYLYANSFMQITANAGKSNVFVLLWSQAQTMKHGRRAPLSLKRGRVASTNRPTPHQIIGKSLSYF